MEIIGVFGEGCGVEFRDITKGFIFGRRNDVGLAVTGCLFLGFGCPLAGEDEIRLARFVHKVKRKHGKLRRRAALQKQYLVIIGDFHKFDKQFLGVVENRLILFGAVAHFHNRLAAIAVA